MIENVITHLEQVTYWPPPRPSPLGYKWMCSGDFSNRGSRVRPFFWMVLIAWKIILPLLWTL